jgi:release factor glutamine methyltransferase
MPAETHLTRADVTAALRAAGCVYADDETQLLLDAAAGAAELAELVARRVAGEPLEQVLGWAEFCGLRVRVAAGVFVPRRRTELLVREALDLVREESVVVDLCCSSGAVGLAIARGAAGLGVDVHCADIDPAAVQCARQNMADVGGHVHVGDLYAALPSELRGRVDVLVVNAPYVPTEAVALMPPEARLHEPLVALDGGADGLDVQRRVIAGAAEWLAPGGHVLIETSEQQAPVTRKLFLDAGFGGVRVVSDDELAATTVIAHH